MRVKFPLILGIVSLIFSSSVFSGELRNISFKDAEKMAIKNSPQIIAQQHIVSSAYEQASATNVQRLPTLGFNAQSTFVSKIGRIDIPELGLSKEVGSHVNWSVGPTINFVVWDTGNILNKAKSLKKSAEAQGNTLDYDKRQVLLSARASYVGVQLAKEQVRLVKDALVLAKAQYNYIADRKKIGTGDDLDLTVAHQEMSDREKDLDEAEGALAASKRALVASLGIEDEIEKADEVDVDPIDGVLNQLLPRSSTAFDAEAHPQVKALANMGASSKLAARSTLAGYFPKVTLQGSAGYQYPNLGENVVIQQNSLTLGLQMPIFEWGSINKSAQSQKFQAKAADEQRRQSMIDLTRDVSETRDWIGTYKKLQDANKKVVKDAVDVARLTFDSYKAGRVIFLDVQRANVKALTAKVDSARNDANLAAQISKLLALTVDEGGEDE